MLPFLFRARSGSPAGPSTSMHDRKRRKAGTRFPLGAESLEGRALLSTVTVHVMNFSFNPDPVSIHVGDTVHWVFDAGGHSTTSVKGIAESWDSTVLAKAGSTFDHTFMNTGSFQYYCRVHGVDNGNGTAGGQMHGTINVAAASGPAATLSSIDVTPGGPGIGVGATQQFTATGHFSDSTTQNLGSQVTWASATPAVATVNASGVGTGVAAGTSTISASFNNVTGTTTLTVSGSVAKVVPTLASEMRMTVGKGAHRKVVGFMLFFNTPLDPAVAQDTSHYQVAQPGATKRSHPVNVSVSAAMYGSGDNSVMLMLGKFNAKKPLTLTATGLLGATGAQAATIVTRL